MGFSNIHFNLDYKQTFLISGIGIIQSFLETSLPIIQWLGAVLGVLLLLKKLFSKNEN